MRADTHFWSLEVALAGVGGGAEGGVLLPQLGWDGEVEFGGHFGAFLAGDHFGFALEGWF